MSPLTVLVALGIIVYVIGQQLVGGALRGKRVVVLPAVLTVIGIIDISGQKSHPDATDIVLLVVSAAIAIATGAGLGAMTRLERRGGHLWAQLPKRGLWLWGGLIISRLAISGDRPSFRRAPRRRDHGDPAGARSQPCRPGAGGRSPRDRGRNPVRAREGRHRVRRQLVLPLHRTRGLSDGVQLAEAHRKAPRP